MPIKDLLINSLPQYCEELVTEKNICFRPMVVGEEKAILISTESGDKQSLLKTLITVVSSCFNEKKDWTISEFEHMFLLLRAKSIGEIEGYAVKCPVTGEDVNIKINLTKNIRLTKGKSNNKIKLNPNLVVVFKEPTLKTLMKYPEYKSSTEQLYGFIGACIKQIQNQKEAIDCSDLSEKEVSEFIQNLTPAQFKLIMEYFDSIPQVEVFSQYTTSDGVNREVQIKGIFDFISFFLNT